MLEKIKRFLKGVRKQQKSDPLFAEKIISRYTGTKNFPRYDPEWIFLKNKQSIKNYAYYTKIYQKYNRISPEKENQMKQIAPEQVVQFIKKLSYHNLSQLQHAIYEKYESYPTIRPYAYRLYSRENQMTQRIKQAHFDKVLEKNMWDAIAELRQELKSSKETIVHLKEFLERVELLPGQRNQENRAAVYAIEQKFSRFSREDYRQITKHVLDELREHVALEKRRRGL